MEDGLGKGVYRDYEGGLVYFFFVGIIIILFLFIGFRGFLFLYLKMF